MDDTLAMPHFGEFFVNLISNREISQRQLALASGISQAQINAICTGKRRLSLEQAVIISKVTGLDSDYLLRLQNHVEEERLKVDKDFQARLEEAKVLVEL